MKPARSPADPAAGLAEPVREAPFFLPDLCRNASLLMLLLVAQLSALIATLLTSGLLRFDWVSLGLHSLFVQWIALASAFLLCRGRPWLARQPERRGLLLAWLVAPLVTWLSGTVVEGFYLGASSLAEALLADRVLRNTVIAGILAGLVFRYLQLQAQLMVRRQSELRHQIQALHSRIKPHFLFNSMNSIASLIAIDPERAEEAVEDLAALFRASLADTGALVPLERELDLCRRYVRIEQLRMGDRLRLHWHSRPLPAGIRIPQLTLQPLLENAIVHGIQPLPEGGEIHVHLGVSHGVFEVRIDNPLPRTRQGTPDTGPVSETGESFQDPATGNRMALGNIRDRLGALYGERAKLTAYVEDNRYITHVTYPVEPPGVAAGMGEGDRHIPG